MAKPITTGWLIGSLVLLTALGLSGAFIRIRTCGACGGLVQELIRRSSPSVPPTLHPLLDCPDCSDSGKVSQFRSWIGPRVSASIADVLRACRDASGKDAHHALKSAIQKDGKDADAFMLKETPGSYPTISPRFIESDGRRHLILMIQSPAWAGDAPSVGILLLSLHGEFLDRVDLLYSNRDVQLFGKVLDGTQADGARITIEPLFGKDYGTSYRLYQWQQTIREGFWRWGDKSDFDGFCRIAIQEGRLEVLTPLKK